VTHDVKGLREYALIAARESDPYGALLERLAGARIVMIGEASHGTHQFYRERAEITKRLISQAGFAAIAVEADWPDALRVSRFVCGQGGDRDAAEALGGFGRFPAWMWRNADVLDFVGWLRDWNDRLPDHRRVGFYGLDLYSLRASIEAVIAYLDRVDPAAAARARRNYSCFDFQADAIQYGYAVQLGLQQPCRDAVIHELRALQAAAATYLRRDGKPAADEYFYAQQNARIAKDAEEYYRTMLDDRISSWNLRDRHMADVLEGLVEHVDRHVPAAKIIVWAHNSHIGDAAATEMSQHGEWNIGELARRRYGEACMLVGFTTYAGTVSAASDWAARSSGKPSVRRSPAVTRSCSIARACRALRLSFAIWPRESGVRACFSSVRSALSIDLRPNGKATISDRQLPGSSTRSFISTTRAPSSRWSARRSGKRAKPKCPKRSRAACSRRFDGHASEVSPLLFDS
jgi:erythromycin esterase-like protein